MSACSSCGAPIVWARTETGKSVPVNFAPTLEGRLFPVGEAAPGVPVVAFVSKNRPAPDGVPRFDSHFSTCPSAAEHRKGRR